jgi:hypothetical protein
MQPLGCGEDFDVIRQRIAQNKARRPAFPLLLIPENSSI